MNYRCHNCVHKLDFVDDNNKFIVCNRIIVFGYVLPNMMIEWGRLECLKPGVCPHKITPKEARLYMEANNDT